MAISEEQRRLRRQHPRSSDVAEILGLPKPDPLPVSDPDGYRVACDTCGALTTDTMLMRCTSCRMRGRDVYE